MARKSVAQERQLVWQRLALIRSTSNTQVSQLLLERADSIQCVLSRTSFFHIFFLPSSGHWQVVQLEDPCQTPTAGCGDIHPTRTPSVCVPNTGLGETWLRFFRSRQHVGVGSKVAGPFGSYPAWLFPLHARPIGV